MSDAELVLEHVFQAPPERVFAAWTDPAIFPRWFGPEGVTIPDLELDARPGGRYRAVMRNAEGGEYEISGEFSEVSPPNRLVFSWAWTQDDGERGHDYTVEVTFMADGDATRMTLRQSVFDEPAQNTSHAQGWNSSFVCLEAELAHDL